MACRLFCLVWNINIVKSQNSSDDFVCVYSAIMCVSLTYICDVNYIFGMESFLSIFVCVLNYEKGSTCVK